MKWEDECFLLSKKKFRENANIINVFTYSRGRVSGVVYGGNSRKVKNYLHNFLASKILKDVMINYDVWTEESEMSFFPITSQ